MTIEWPGKDGKHSRHPPKGMPSVNLALERSLFAFKVLFALTDNAFTWIDFGNIASVLKLYLLHFERIMRACQWVLG